MIEIFWGDYFKKRYKKWFQKNQNLANIFEMKVAIDFYLTLIDISFIFITISLMERLYVGNLQIKF